MKRFGAILFISAYLCAMSWGIVSHAVKYKVGSHPIMYYVVWDMFCGWSAYSNRLQVIAEGESGKYYEVSPAPWGELNPFGHIERRHYDPFDDLIPKIIKNNLRNTTHEPIANVYVIEEVWPKKYNLPDDIWEEKFGKPKNLQPYYNVRSVFTGDGVKTQCNLAWYQLQIVRSVANNPRLQQQAAGSQPFFTNVRSGNSMAPAGN